MTCTSISGRLTNSCVNALKASPLLVLLLVGMLMTSSAPAQAQNNDAWISAAIIGGSTAAGAIIGHRVAGTTGAYVGAAVGGATGYAIDRRRRQSQYNNGYYGDNGGYSGNGQGDSGGPYPNNRRSRNNGGYGNDGGYGNNYPQSGDGGYGDPSAYPARFRSNN